MASDTGFLSRPNLRSLASDEWDECVADLQYRDAGEYAVGHNVATQAFIETDECRRVRTHWIPQAEVEHVSWNDIPGAEMSMDALSQMEDSAEATAKLIPVVEQYRKWIDRQLSQIPDSRPSGVRRGKSSCRGLALPQIGLNKAFVCWPTQLASKPFASRTN